MTEQNLTFAPFPVHPGSGQGIHPSFTDITGRQVGRLTVVGYAGDCRWWCRCRCGNVRAIRSSSLRPGYSKSCGCFRSDKARLRAIDIRGRRFGRLLVIRRAGIVRRGTKGKTLSAWLCRCDCGNTKTLPSVSLLHGKTKSCGCFRADELSSRSPDLTGRRFGRLVVIGPASIQPARQRGNYRIWSCLCDCGNSHEVPTGRLTNGWTTSCGCWQKTNIGIRNTTHGESRGGKTPEYRCWRHMMHRCHNPADRAYRYYGGRGIAVCDRWRNSFANFLADVGRRPSAKHTLDRYPDPDGDYEPGNVRWATMAEQNRNKACVTLVEFCGENLSLAAFAKRIGASERCTKRRLGCGQTPDEIAAAAEQRRSRKTNKPKNGWVNSHPLYPTWQQMVRRCHSPKSNAYVYYGARGIHVCEAWRKRRGFWTWLADMGAKPSPKHTLGRCDNDRGYDCGHCDDCKARGAPPNCQWQTRAEQSRNTRATRHLTFRGETKCLQDWANQIGLDSRVIAQRIDKFGWSVDRALTEPVLRSRRSTEAASPPR